MDLDSAKENIQPLAGGRNISLLQFALNADSRKEEHEAIIERRREYEEQLKNFEGEDPLELWLEYIKWIEQVFPRSGKESEFQEALQRCLQLFEHQDKYKQDVRMVKLYIKFIDSQPQPNGHEYFRFLYNQGIGTMVADLYLGWAYYFEAVGNYDKANEIYNLGLGARAQPIEQLRHAHTQLQILAAESVRFKGNEDYNSQLMARMGERRFALTSLHGHTKKKLVGSLRTDAAVKSRNPGLVLQENTSSSANNVSTVPVFVAGDEEEDVDGIGAVAGGEIKSVVDSAIKAQENLCEPGPWSKCDQKGNKKKALFSKNELASNPGFEICEDSFEAEEQAPPPRQPTTPSDEPGVVLPPNFVRCNEPQDNFQVPLTLAEETKAQPAYIKSLVYPPVLNKEYSLEEIRAYRYWNLRTHRPDSIRVLLEMESFMDRIHLPPDFATKNQPQTPQDYEYYPFDGAANQKPMCKVLSVDGCHQTYEDLLKEKYLLVMAAKQKTESKCQKLSKVTMIYDGNEMDITEIERSISPRPVVQPPPRTSDPIDDDPQQFSRSPRESFGFNETCSTQVFNLFIKPQSISTPNRNKTNADRPAIPRSSLSLYRHQQMQGEEVLLESSMEERHQQASSGKVNFAKQQQTTTVTTSPAENVSPEMIHCGGKQLSVIMETTESSASSGGCQTTTEATTRFGISSLDFGMAPNSTAKPRKSILKKTDYSNVVEEKQAVVDVASPTNVDVFENNRQQEAFSIFVDEPEVVVKEKATESCSFAMPAPKLPPSLSAANPKNVSIYRDSMDFFGAPPPAMNKDGDFAMPLPPKAKTFMPLYNDSMEQFKEKAKNVGRIPIPGDDEEEEAEQQMMEQSKAAGAALMPDFSIFQDSIVDNGEMRSLGAIPKQPSLQHQQHQKSPLGVSCKENFPAPKDQSPNVSMSPLKSFMTSQQRNVKSRGNDSDFDSFLESPPKKGAGGKSKDHGTSTESMPTIAAIDPQLLEITFPSMKDITTHLDGTKRINTNHTMSMKDRSIFGKMQQPSMVLPSTTGLMMEESMTFNTLIRNEGGMGNKSKAGEFNPNLSILALQKELDMDGEEEKGRAESVGKLPPTNINPMEESMTFNTLMRKEQRGLSTLVTAVENLHLKSAEPTTTTLFAKPPQFLNESLTFNSLMKKETDPFMKPLNAANQSSFPMELPSSTAHGFSIFAKKKDFERPTDLHSMRMEKSISPIPSIRQGGGGEEDMMMDEMMDEMLMEPTPKGKMEKGSSPSVVMVINEGEEDEKGDADDIYKFENTLRVLPEDAEPDPDSWYSDNHLEQSVRMCKRSKEEVAQNEAVMHKRRMGGEQYVDPFDPDVINNFLASVDFVNYAHKLNECDMRETIPPLRQNSQLEICEHVFNVRKLIGKGAFGQIYSAKTSEGKLVALKQSRPCNLWEYYICMEVKFRLKEFNEDLLPALIDIEYALVAKNASVFVLPFCPYGNLINICNEVKKETGRNLNEKVAMVLSTQILTIIDALHACQIIHADIKPDNFMLMGPIDGNFDKPMLKLIDFGQAIDMQLFPPNVEFTSSLATDGFTCSEMLENRPWTYHTDLFCVAGTIHTLLMGKYMTVQKGVAGYSVSKFPRYLQKNIWDEIFGNFLNVRDCQTMPNLQDMKLLLKQYISDNENAVLDEVRKFNQIVRRVHVLDK